MIRWPRLIQVPLARRPHAVAPQSPRARLLWTVGNFLMVLGVVVLLYVGGLYATDQYGTYAARGDSDVPALDVVDTQSEAEPAPFAAPPVAAPTAAAARTAATAAAPPQPMLPGALARGDTPQDAAPVAQALPAPVTRPAQISRLIIPSIKLDAKVIEVGWDMVEDSGAPLPVWQVAKYAVGQHHGSANPGDGDNIVLAGHVGGYGHVFRDLFYVHPGDALTLYSAGKTYQYTVKERLIVTEEGVSPEQHAENAKLIMPTGTEEVTMVTCWPPTGKDKFTQRVVVRAVPATP